METIGAAEFKQRCLQLLDEVGPEGILITKRGKPVARLMPARTNDGDLIGALEGRIIVDPDDDLSTASAWEAGKWERRD
ncbi:MAG: type II toxin-antitoxin system Phd/YefM family antitoxin [Dehalococcoidia bacterium]